MASSRPDPRPPIPFPTCWLQAGTQEAGKVLAFAAAGFDPVQGFAGGILSRIRELFWALLGLAFFYCRQAR